jgi:hypothetical protein
VVIALITAYMCDLGGFKARVPGLPISAKVPLHVGKRVQLAAGATIGELIENNPVRHDSDYVAPWVGGIDFAQTECRDELELLLWPWRRLQIYGDKIVIAPGASMGKPFVDPWVLDKAKLSQLDEPAPEGFEITALVLNQALPVACWRG